MRRRILAIIAAAVVALVGVSSVVLYAKGADARAAAAQEPRTVFVAKEAVPTGTKLKDAVSGGQLVKTSLAAKGVPAGALAEVTATNENLYALTDIAPGEYVLEARFGAQPQGVKAISVPEGQVAVSISLSDPARVGTFMTPGSRVVLFDTFEAAAAKGAEGAGTQTRVLLDDVLVIAMGATSLTPTPKATEGADDAAAAPAQAGALLTVAVTPDDAVRLVHGIQTGQLYAALRGDDAKVDTRVAVTSASLFDGS